MQHEYQSPAPVSYTHLLIKQFFGTGALSEDRMLEVGERDTLSLGLHRLRFLLAPMVHWPCLLYTSITNDYSMRQVLRLYLEAWRAGVKTIYYVRSKALEVEDCESCSS